MNEVTTGSVIATPETANAETQNATAQTETPKAPEANYSDKFARLAQLDKAQRLRDADLKTKMRELQEKELSVKDRLELAELFEKDPIAAIRKKGLNLHELYSKGINDLEIDDDPVRKELAELKAWKQSLEEKEVQSKTDSQKRQENELNEKKTAYLDHLSNFVKTNEDKFPLLSSFDDASEKVYEVITTVYEQTGKVITEEEASTHVQKELADLYQKVLNKKGVMELFNLNSNNTDNTLESIFKPESGVTIDQSFNSATKQSSPLGSEEERMAAAIKLAEQMFKSNSGF